MHGWTYRRLGCGHPSLSQAKGQRIYGNTSPVPLLRSYSPCSSLRPRNSSVLQKCWTPSNLSHFSTTPRQLALHLLPPPKAQLSSHTCPVPSEEFRMSHAGRLWGLLLMQTSSSSRQPVVWMPQCSRYLLAWAFAVKFMAELGLWHRHPQLAALLHWAPVQEGRHPLCGVKHGSCSEPFRVPVNRQWRVFWRKGLLFVLQVYSSPDRRLASTH